MKTLAFSLVLRTPEHYRFFTTLDEIYLVFTSKKVDILKISLKLKQLQAINGILKDNVNVRGKRSSSVARHLPPVLEVPGSIPAHVDENVGVRTPIILCHLQGWR